MFNTLWIHDREKEIDDTARDVSKAVIVISCLSMESSYVSCSLLFEHVYNEWYN